MKISDVAKLTGVTVRTLHYYGKIMQDPAYDKENALQKQKELLLQKRNRLDGLLSLVDKILKGEQDMSFEQFDTSKIEETKKKYAAEAKRRWGDTAAYAEYEEKMQSDGASQKRSLLLKSGRTISQPITTPARRRSFAVLVRCTSETNALCSTSTSTGTAQPRLWRRLSRSIPVKEKLRLSICPCLFRRRSASSPYPTESAPRYLPRWYLRQAVCSPPLPAGSQTAPALPRLLQILLLYRIWSGLFPHKA